MGFSKLELRHFRNSNFALRSSQRAPRFTALCDKKQDDLSLFDSDTIHATWRFESSKLEVLEKGKRQTEIKPDETRNNQQSKTKKTHFVGNGHSAQVMTKHVFWQSAYVNDLILVILTLWGLAILITEEVGERRWSACLVVEQVVSLFLHFKIDWNCAFISLIYKFITTFCIILLFITIYGFAFQWKLVALTARDEGLFSWANGWTNRIDGNQVLVRMDYVPELEPEGSFAAWTACYRCFDHVFKDLQDENEWFYEQYEKNSFKVVHEYVNIQSLSFEAVWISFGISSKGIQGQLFKTLVCWYPSVWWRLWHSLSDLMNQGSNSTLRAVAQRMGKCRVDFRS